MYNTVAELLTIANRRQLPLWEIILEQEQNISGHSRQQIWDRMEQRYQVMEESASRALSIPLDAPGGLITGTASTHYRYALGQSSVCGQMINIAMARALSCSESNAAMGRICAAPTAGACGILPAVLITVGEARNLPRHQLIEALATASGFGTIITQNATISGAEGGCQAECGVAAAMAAAAVTQLMGGTAQTAADACALALINCLGLVCDPVAGLVQVPCAQRNASQTVNALISADLALAGMASLIPADEVIEAMYRVGRSMAPELRETALGGIAASPTAKKLAAQLYPAPLPQR